ncbi:palmitoyltransferase ZDHHC11-like isoform X2 [Protopterus annectens]|uniref:palmitoyltransferase ZDHHC11-like isoform X2 n=1 Tax=Protopterus annectens TaxID=7888 RepID=UPI001CFAC01F|nr:palmitoyltransferase ZDHHC11-like isoform X2 [Protopterus annectens]
MEKPSWLTQLCVPHRTATVLRIEAIRRGTLTCDLQMNCYDRRLRRTGPAHGSSKHDLISAPQHSRVNGWSLPLHVFQLIAWLLYTYFAIVGFGIYIPLLPYGWKYAAYVIIGLIFVYHFVVHLVAVSIDPADPNVLAKKNYNSPMPVLDRNIHPHAIQNLHCYLCEVNVEPKAKHCSACNKCVSRFDHHCKWLNNCVGGQNYWFFFNTVVSAVCGIFSMVIVILYVFIQHFVNPAELRTDPKFQSVSGNKTWLAFLPSAPVETSSAGILVIAVITLVLNVASLLLLGHLLGFHIYLLSKKLSTYEYIVHQRHSQENKEHDKSVQPAPPLSARMAALQTLTAAAGLQTETEALSSTRSSAFKCPDQVYHVESNGMFAEPSDMNDVMHVSLCQQQAAEKTPDPAMLEKTEENGGNLPAVLKLETLVPSHGDQESECKRLSKKFRQPSLESIEEIPTVQNPLGSSIMSNIGALYSADVDKKGDIANQNSTLHKPQTAAETSNFSRKSLSLMMRTSQTKLDTEFLQGGTLQLPSPHFIESPTDDSFSSPVRSPRPSDIPPLPLRSSSVTAGSGVDTAVV